MSESVLTSRAAWSAFGRALVSAMAPLLERGTRNTERGVTGRTGATGPFSGAVIADQYSPEKSEATKRSGGYTPSGQRSRASVEVLLPECHDDRLVVAAVLGCV